jgi:CheY-like chemotaxis protein
LEDDSRLIVPLDWIASSFKKERVPRIPDGFSAWVCRSRMTATILLIDDNAVQAATRQTILKRAGYFVIAALNPVRALEQFQSGDFPAEIRLVITDHLMPGMSGADFVRGLRKTHPAMPVMVISGLAEAEEDYNGLNVTFRQKPLLPELLLASVQSLLQSGGVGRTDATASSVR